jgi:hypothetical protein
MGDILQDRSPVEDGSMQVPIPESMRAVDDARATAGGAISSP